MNILNKKDATADQRMHFQPSSSTDVEILYFKWLEQVWLPTLLKSDPGWAFPVEVDEVPDFVKGLDPEPHLYVSMPGQARTRIYPQSPYDVKDARAGILYYYAPARSTLYQYSQYLAGLRDYLTLELFVGKPEKYDVRKHTVSVVEVASEQWHAEQIATLERRREERRILELEIMVTDGRDYTRLCEFKSNGKKWALVRLLTANALAHESGVMLHCVHSYYDKIFNGYCVVLSVRDVENITTPVLTVELTLHPTDKLDNAEPYKRNIVQIKAKRNGPADDVIPNITQNMPVILRGLDRSVLNPLTNRTSFKV